MCQGQTGCSREVGQAPDGWQAPGLCKAAHTSVGSASAECGFEQWMDTRDEKLACFGLEPNIVTPTREPVPTMD